jgi:type IV pilus assembly protein PilY1
MQVVVYCQIHKRECYFDHNSKGWAMKQFKAWLNPGLLIMASMLFGGLAQADDTDIFFGNTPQTNVLFIIDNSDSMAYPVRDEQGNPTSMTRMEALKRAFPAIINGLSPDVNVGLMRLNTEASVAYPVLPSASAAVEVNNWVQGMEVVWGTAITDALWEAQQYYAGRRVDFGKTRDRPLINGNLKQHYRVSHPDSYNTGGRHRLPRGCRANDLGAPACASEEIASAPTPMYISPITSNCQKNHIVLLTDGAPTLNNSQNRIENLIGRRCDNDAPNQVAAAQCVRSLAGWMANNAVNPRFSDSKVQLHTIAFNLNSPVAVDFLKDLARKGNGFFYEASSPQELRRVFGNLFFDMIDNDSVFTPMGSSTNEFNRRKHRNELYFSVFKPSLSPRWQGNLKKYQWGTTGGAALRIEDRHGRAAIDPDTGFFKSTSTSFWSTSADGGKARFGGAASQLKVPADRKLLTNVNGLSLSPLRNGNTAITQSLLGAANAAERTKLLSWIRGIDVDDENENNDTTDARLFMGAPVHSAPALVTYGGTNANPDITIFLGTNEGFLHAIEAGTGDEQFAFMPKSLLKNIKPLMINRHGQSLISGMDGSPVIWRKDVDLDNQIESGDGDFVRLYMGMRRGGRDYYALDVTNRNNPRVLWQIQGGAGDFAALGQTWSTPVKTKVKIGPDIKDVLLFAGGFDPAVDDQPNQAVEVSMGNAIYMVDALSGERLWMASKVVDSDDGLALSNMKYAIPSALKVVVDKDTGLANQIYVGDLGGQIWRFDIRNGMTRPADLVSGGLIASLGSNDNAIANNPNHRRFFSAPDLSTTMQDGTGMRVLAIGSGSVIDPRSVSTQDRFYVLTFPARGIPDYANLTPVTEANLTDRTETINNQPVSTSGWYIKMQGAGEKVLASSLTFKNQLIFTSYTPNNTSTDCQMAAGYGRYYVVDVANGNPKKDMDGDRDLDQQDRSQRLKSSSIPQGPTISFQIKGNKATNGVEDLSGVDASLPEDDQPVYWFKEPI